MRGLVDERTHNWEEERNDRDDDFTRFSKNRDCELKKSLTVKM